jgi:chemotaxis protein CheD
LIVLGLGDFGVTSDPLETLKTIGLGSCVAVICSAPSIHLAGMIHIVLPDSATANGGGRHPPGYFADTGLPHFFQNLAKVGYSPATMKLSVKLVGGSNIMDTAGAFNIGKRNVLAIRKILWGMGLGPSAEDVGGSISRTVSIEAATGKVIIQSPGMQTREI